MGETACWVGDVCPACGRLPSGDTSTPRPLLVMVGLMGVGKTTVGGRVADLLGWDFVDNDVLFEERTGLTASAYAVEHGDEAMHDVEWDLLAEALDRSRPTVLAAPGSVVDAPSVDLRDAFVVWLRADPDEVADRVRIGDHRPLLGDEPAGVLRRQLAERSKGYRRVADLTVDAAGRSPSQLAERIVAAWCRRAQHG